MELRYDPVPVNVTLLDNGSGGEGTQFIDVTPVQDISFSPIEEFRVLVKPTVRITIPGALSTYKDIIDYIHPLCTAAACRYCAVCLKIMLFIKPT